MKPGSDKDKDQIGGGAKVVFSVNVSYQRTSWISKFTENQIDIPFVIWSYVFRCLDLQNSLHYVRLQGLPMAFVGPLCKIHKLLRTYWITTWKIIQQRSAAAVAVAFVFR